MSNYVPKPSARVVGHVQIPPTTVVRHDLKDMQFQPPTPHVTFERIAVRRVSFRDSDFFFLGVFGCIFEDCDFTGARISAGQLSHFPPSIFRRCRFHGLDLRTVSPFTARFEECSFSNSDLRGWNCALTEFVRCVFAGPLVKVLFSGRPWGPGAHDKRLGRSKNEFTGNDFRQADLRDCSFRWGIKVSEQLWPESDDYICLDNFQKRVAGARREIERWEDVGPRKEALLVLDVYSTDGEREQEEFFGRRDDIPMDPSTRDRLWALLAKD
jgi:hypothetical protein